MNFETQNNAVQTVRARWEPWQIIGWAWSPANGKVSTPVDWIMGNCTLHLIQWYTVDVAGASEGEGKNGGRKIFWRAAFLQPGISHFQVFGIWSVERSQIYINCWCNLNCKLTNIFVEWSYIFYFSVEEFKISVITAADDHAWWHCLRLFSYPGAFKSRVSPLIMACHLYLRALAASSLSFPPQRPWLLSCCLTLNRRLHGIH